MVSENINNLGKMIAQRNAFGEALVEIADKYPQMVVFDPDVCASTQTHMFKNKYPERFYEMGIAEANSVGVAAGMASCGYVPWVSTFAVFLAKRACDQIRVSVAHTGLPVKLNAAYGGLPSGRGGATHSSVEDIAIMRAMPGMTIFTPADAIETKAMVSMAMTIDAPIYLRTVRCEVPNIFEANYQPEFGKVKTLNAGNDVAIVSEGMMTARVLAAIPQLLDQGINARVLHISTIKPFDIEAIVKAARECKKIITVENHSVIGGLGGAVCEAVAQFNPCEVHRLGFPDVFMESGDDEIIFDNFGLSTRGIFAKVLEVVKNRRT